MSFRALKEVPSHDLKRAVIGNSITSFAAGWAIQPGATTHNTAVVGAANSGLVLGVCLAIEGNAGQVLELNSKTTASNNETVVGIKAVYLPSYIPMEYEVEMDDVAGTTTDSGGLAFFNLVSGNPALIDESTITLFGGTAGQFWSFGTLPYKYVSTRSVISGHWYKTL